MARHNVLGREIAEPAEHPLLPSEVARQQRDDLERGDPGFARRLRDLRRARARGLAEWQRLLAEGRAETSERSVGGLPAPRPVE